MKLIRPPELDSPLRVGEGRFRSSDGRRSVQYLSGEGLSQGDQAVGALGDDAAAHHRSSAVLLLIDDH